MNRMYLRTYIRRIAIRMYVCTYVAMKVTTLFSSTYPFQPTANKSPSAWGEHCRADELTLDTITVGAARAVIRVGWHSGADRVALSPAACMIYRITARTAGLQVQLLDKPEADIRAFSVCIGSQETTDLHQCKVVAGSLFWGRYARLRLYATSWSEAESVCSLSAAGQQPISSRSAAVLQPQVPADCLSFRWGSGGGGGTGHDPAPSQVQPAVFSWVEWERHNVGSGCTPPPSRPRARQKRCHADGLGKANTCRH